MNAPNRTTKSAGSPGNGGQVLREAVETGAAETQQAFEKMSAATANAAHLVTDSYSTALRRAQDYNMRVVEFAQKNTEAALQFVQKLSSVKTPTEFFELSTDHSRRQFETLSGQANELAGLAQKAVMATVEDVNKAYNRRS